MRKPKWRLTVSSRSIIPGVIRLEGKVCPAWTGLATTVAAARAIALSTAFMNSSKYRDRILHHVNYSKERSSRKARATHFVSPRGLLRGLVASRLVGPRRGCCEATPGLVGPRRRPAGVRGAGAAGPR